MHKCDVLIHGGLLVDGSGAAGHRADVAVVDGRVVAIDSDLSQWRCDRRIDAGGKIVCPGFIDLHTHASGGLRSDESRRRAAPNMVMDGVTTAIVNLDGFGGWPIAGQLREMRDLGIGPNAAALVPHNVIRARVLGKDARRAATAEEVDRMRTLVREGMAQGAWGISAGLEYRPGRWSTTDELVALVREVVPFGGIYTSHQRSEGYTPLWYRPSDDVARPPTVLDAVGETIEIGERTGARVIATHLKTKAPMWGSGSEIISLIETARARGVDIWADQYSYETSGSDGAVELIPAWAFEGDGSFAEQLSAVLADAGRASVLRSDIEHEIAKRGGAERIVVLASRDSAQVGETLARLAGVRSIDPVEMVIQIQFDGDPDVRGGARLRGYSLDQADVETFMRMPWTACASDGRIEVGDGDPHIHPRRYGNFARRLRHYALDRGVVPLEFAIRSATGLPAQILGLGDRGLLRPGYAADIVVLDPERVRDAATIEEPHQFSEGFEHVFVNGVPVVSDGKPTWNLPGSVLARPGATVPDPTPRAAYFTDFGNHAPAKRPAGWSPTWRKGRWRVAEHSGVLRQEFRTRGRRALTWDEVGETTGDVEVFARVRGGGSRTLFALGVHLSGMRGLECGYMADVRSGRLRINRYSYGRHDTLAATTLDASEDTWLAVLIRREGTQLRAKAWAEADAEPDWMITATDHTFDTGKIGVGGVDAGSVAEWRCIGIGTSGAPAPRDG